MAYIFFILAIFIILLIPTMLFSLVRTLLSILGFCIGGRRRGRGASSGASSQSDRDYGGNASYRRNDAGAAGGQRKKVFDKDEGEYVDFEDIE